VQPPFNRLYKSTFGAGRNYLSLAYLAGTIKKETDWDVMVYNTDYSFTDERVSIEYLTGGGFSNYIKNLHDMNYVVWKEIRQTIEDYRPAVVGISAMSQTFASVRVVADIAKSIDENTIVVVGGPHPSMVKGKVLNAPSIDIGVFGEGEATIVDLLRSLENERSLTSVLGIVYRDGKTVVENAHRNFIQDLDSLPFPIDIFPDVLKDYNKYSKQSFADIFAVRGCPYNCSFCGSRKIWSRRVRWRSVGNIILEIKQLQKAGVKHVYFADDTFGVKKIFIRALCKAIRRHCPGVIWWCEMHVKLVTHEIVGLMKKAGCTRIQIGVESGNNEMLKKIRKNITVEEALSAAQIIRDNNIMVEAFFMVGFAHETEDSLNDTINLIRTFPCDTVCYSIFMPYPGTDLFERCKKAGSIPEDFDFSLYNHQSPLNYFCQNIPQDLFRAYLGNLEKEIDLINARNYSKRVEARQAWIQTSYSHVGLVVDFLKRNLSYEGLLKIRDRSLISNVALFINLLQKLLR